jgi:hypothetical protein
MAPEASTPLQLTQTAAYSIGITPGNATWSLQSRVVLPPAYAAAGEVHMFSGDRVVSWQQDRDSSRSSSSSKNEIAAVAAVAAAAPAAGSASASKYWSRTT